MADLVTAMTTLFTGAMTNAGSVLTFITAEGHEIVFVWLVLPLVGLGIGILRRIFKVAR